MAIIYPSLSSNTKDYLLERPPSSKEIFCFEAILYGVIFFFCLFVGLIVMIVHFTYITNVKLDKCVVNVEQYNNTFYYKGIEMWGISTENPCNTTIYQYESNVMDNSTYEYVLSEVEELCLGEYGKKQQIYVPVHKTINTCNPNKAKTTMIIFCAMISFVVVCVIMYVILLKTKGS